MTCFKFPPNNIRTMFLLNIYGGYEPNGFPRWDNMNIQTPLERKLEFAIRRRALSRSYPPPLHPRPPASGSASNNDTAGGAESN